jgi:hypothetical protein
MPDRRTPLWLLPNLLSLDAPLVAVAWLYLFARTWRVDYLPAVAYVALGLAVWAVYIFDRLLDAGLRGTGSDLLQARHRFHLAHKRAFFVTGMVAALTALVLALVAMPIEVLRYAVLGFLLTLVFFAMALFSNHRCLRDCRGGACVPADVWLGRFDEIARDDLLRHALHAEHHGDRCVGAGSPGG